MKVGRLVLLLIVGFLGEQHFVQAQDPVSRMDLRPFNVSQTPQADLSISGKIYPASESDPRHFPVRIWVSNSGPDSADAVHVALSQPPLEAPKSCFERSGLYFCPLGVLANGEKASLDFAIASEEVFLVSGFIRDNNSSNNSVELSPAVLSLASPVCGDRHLDPGETCDDGNLQEGDGCSSDCQPETKNSGR